MRYREPDRITRTRMLMMTEIAPKRPFWTCEPYFTIFFLFTKISLIFSHIPLLENLFRKAPKKQTTKLRLQISEKFSCKMYHVEKNQRQDGKHYEPSHLDLQHLQIHLLLCLTLYEVFTSSRSSSVKQK